MWRATSASARHGASNAVAPATGQLSARRAPVLPVIPHDLICQDACRAPCARTALQLQRGSQELNLHAGKRRPRRRG